MALGTLGDILAGGSIGGYPVPPVTGIPIPGVGQGGMCGNNGDTKVVDTTTGETTTQPGSSMGGGFCG